MKFLKTALTSIAVGAAVFFWYVLLFIFMLLTIPVRLLLQAHTDKIDWLARADFEDAARRINPLVRL